MCHHKKLTVSRIQRSCGKCHCRWQNPHNTDQNPVLSNLDEPASPDPGDSSSTDKGELSESEMEVSSGPHSPKDFFRYLIQSEVLFTTYFDEVTLPGCEVNIDMRFTPAVTVEATESMTGSNPNYSTHFYQGDTRNRHGGE